MHTIDAFCRCWEGNSLSLRADLPEYPRPDLAQGAAKVLLYPHGSALTAVLDSSLSFSYRLIDFWQKTLAEGMLQPGDNPLPPLTTGWYRLSIDAPVPDIYLTVVPECDFTEKDTPFAMDFASYYLLQNRFKSSEMVYAVGSAARMTGVRWVRERLNWCEIEPHRGQYNLEPMAECYEAIHNVGLKNLAMMCIAPAWAHPEGYPSTGNAGPGGFFGTMKDIYRTARRLAERYAGIVDGWELWNESDLFFAGEPADLYSAWFKAGVVGLSDSGADFVRSFGGYCATNSDSCNNYTELTLANGIMAYSDIYNYHAHIGYAGKPVTNYDCRQVVADHHENSAAYNQQNKPVWVTEAGMKLFYNQKDDQGNIIQRPDIDQLLGQTRYLITSTAQSLAMGTAKHFWFVLAPFIEEGGDFGCFSRETEPYPVMAAEAIITKILGDASYRGRFTHLPDSAEGHLFETGSGEAAVLWSAHQASITLPTEKAVILTDMMGASRTLVPEEGKISLELNEWPVYLTFNGSCDPSVYAAQRWDIAPVSPAKLSFGQRVILCPSFDENNFFRAKADGHRLSDSGITEMTLTLLNLNDSPAEGSLFWNAGELSVEGPAAVHLDPWEEKALTFTIRVPEKLFDGFRSNIAFYGSFNGYACEPAVTCVQMPERNMITEFTTLPGWDDPARWNVNNIGANGHAECSRDENGLTFRVNFGQGDRWFYPRFEVNPADLAGSRGLVFNLSSDFDLQNINPERSWINVFAYTSDHCSYFLGEGSDRMCRFPGTTPKQFRIPWQRFMLFSSPWGDYEVRPFEPSKIVCIAVGLNINGGEVSPVYTVDQLAVYSDEPDGWAFRERISLSEDQPGKTVIATLPNDALDQVDVRLNQMPFDRVIRRGRQLEIDLSSLTPGAYRLLVTAHSPDNRQISGTTSFVVRGD